MKDTEEDALAQISSHQVVFLASGKTMVYADRDKIVQVIQTSSATR